MSTMNLHASDAGKSMKDTMAEMPASNSSCSNGNGQSGSDTYTLRSHKSDSEHPMPASTTLPRLSVKGSSSALVKGDA